MIQIGVQCTQGLCVELDRFFFSFGRERFMMDLFFCFGFFACDIALKVQMARTGMCLLK